MRDENLHVVRWPNLPPRPAQGEPALVQVPLSTPRLIARQQLRVVARTILATWRGEVISEGGWHETPQGPVCLSLVDGHPVFLSFSYTEDSGWIAFSIDHAVGVDALRVQPFAELESVARLYFSPATAAAVLDAENPPRAFARAWTAWEARLKLYRRNFGEFSDPPCDGPELREYIFDHGGAVVTLLTDYPLLPASLRKISVPHEELNFIRPSNACKLP